MIRKFIDRLLGKTPAADDGMPPGVTLGQRVEYGVDQHKIDPKLVAEAQFDHFTGGRFRHGTKFLRWRPEKNAHDCTMKQVKRENKSALNLL